MLRRLPFSINMGIDYGIWHHVGFKVNREWNDEIAQLIRTSIDNGVLDVRDYDYLVFKRLTQLVFVDRVRNCMDYDRITGQASYPDTYFKTRKSPDKIPALTDEELDIIQITESKLEYYEEAEIS